MFESVNGPSERMLALDMMVALAASNPARAEPDDKSAVSAAMELMKSTVSIVRSTPSNSKLGAANVLTGSPICLGTIETESITGTKISSEIQILDFSPNLEGSGS